MHSVLSLLTVVVLLICQRAGVLYGGTDLLLTLIAVHVVAVVLSIADSLQQDGSIFPRYKRATVISDAGNAGGKAISSQHDDVLIGTIVGGVFFGVPIVTQMFSEDSPWNTTAEQVAVLIVVAITPLTLYVAWKRLRLILWTLPVAALAYTVYQQFAT